MSVIYTDNLSNININQLQGFFNNWKNPLSPQNHFKLLKNSSYIILAIDIDQNKVIGFITALSDNITSAFIPLLEVLPEYKNNGIGSILIKKMLDKLKHISNIDLTCNESLKSYYIRFGFQPARAMVIRKYLY